MPTNRELFLNLLAQTSPIPLGIEPDYAEGFFIHTKDGKKYLDLISGISVSSLGHRHPVVLEALQEQMHKYLHLMVYGEYVQTPQVKLAEKLISTLPENLNSVYFTNSGAEATEGAMKLAKRVTGRSEFGSFLNAYHGSTQGALSLAGNESLKQAFRPLLPGTIRLKYNDEECLKSITEQTAAVFFEFVQAEAGCIIPDLSFLKALAERCKQTGTLMVADEIQTGMGRTGSLWAFEQTGIVPDILLLGKAFGGGMPLGAFVAKREMMLQLSHNPVLGHITTFGGHPMSCAAALAALTFTLENKLWEKATHKEKLVRETLKNSKIKQIHGKGLLLALELNSFEHVQQTIKKLLEKGIITDWFLFNDKCLRLAPPLIVEEDVLVEACKEIAASLS